MSAWKTIDSAPKDGTGILVCTDDGSGRFGYAVVMWMEDDGETYVSERREAGGGWVMDDGHDLFDYRHYTRGPRRNLMGPTHWMPLPAPPLPGESNARFIAGPKEKIK